MQYIDLAYTKVTDKGLRDLSEVGKREYPGLSLDLRGSQVTSYGVAQFLRTMPEPAIQSTVWLTVDQGSVSHRTMFFGDSQLTDTQFRQFRGISSFYQVDLSNTQITDAALTVVASLGNLGYLNVSGTQITDTGLKQLTKLKGLISLDVRDTSVTRKGTILLQQALPNCRISGDHVDRNHASTPRHKKK